MNLIINGEDHHDLPHPLTVAGLIAHLGLPEKKIAIERNREIVPKSTFGQAALSCLLYTSPSPRDATLSRMPSSA